MSMTREEQIRLARQLLESGVLSKESANAIKADFPELAESEDERIRKEMIYFFTEGIPLCSIKEHADRMRVFISWLEKQKEQKQAEYLELKAGHWYVCHRAFCCRADHLTVREGERFMCEKDGVVKGFVIKEPEKYFMECNAPAPLEEEQKPVEWSEEDEKIRQDLIEYLVGGEPIHNPYLTAQKSADWLKSLRPQPKMEWSEEDSFVLEDAITAVDLLGNDDKYKESHPNLAKAFRVAKDWLKSLPNRFTLQPKAEWSEEDEKMVRFWNMYYEHKVYDWPNKDVVEHLDRFKEWLNNRLKSLRPQPKQEQQIKEGDRVSIHCRKDRREDIITIYDGKVGEVFQIWDDKTNPWGYIGVRLDNGCNNSFYEDELEVLDEP